MALATLARAIMSVYGPEQAEIFLIDPHTELAQVVEGRDLGTTMPRSAARPEAGLRRGGVRHSGSTGAARACL